MKVTAVAPQFVIDSPDSPAEALTTESKAPLSLVKGAAHVADDSKTNADSQRKQEHEKKSKQEGDDLKHEVASGTRLSRLILAHTAKKEEPAPIPHPTSSSPGEMIVTNVRSIDPALFKKPLLERALALYGEIQHVSVDEDHSTMGRLVDKFL